MDKAHERDKTVLDPKTEFIGHCSNLQAWYENGYNLGILHSSLSFPLLKVLSMEGDSRAKMVLKELVAILTAIQRDFDYNDDKMSLASITSFMNKINNQIRDFNRKPDELVTEIIGQLEEIKELMEEE